MAPNQKRLWWIIGSVLAAALVVWVLFPRESRLDSWLAQMRARGEVFELAAFRPEGARETNGNEEFEAAARKLGRVYSGYVVGTRDLAPGRIQLLWLGEASEPTEGLSWAELERALADAQPVLEELRTLVKNPPAELGWDYEDPLNLPVNLLVVKRATAQTVLGDLVLALHRQDKSRALEDIECLCNLARMHEREYTLVEQMIRQAIAGLALSGSWQALQLEGWSQDQLARLQIAWDRVRVLDALPRTVEVERAMAYSTFQWVRMDPKRFQRIGISGGNAAADWVHSKAWRLFWAEADILRVLQTEQAVLEGFRAGTAGRSWAEVKQRMDPAFALLDDVKGPWGYLRSPVAGVTIPNWQKASEHLIEFEAKRGMLEMVLALERYRVQHGDWPTTLGDLAPELLAFLPRDPMNGELFRYLRHENGTWTLYSVGTNGVDDGGDPSPIDSTQRGIRPWGGKDLVWPGVGEPGLDPRPAAGNDRPPQSRLQ